MLSLTDWAASILESHEDILVPVKKLWAEYSKKHSGVTLPEFTRVIEQDSRFTFEQGMEYDEKLEDMSATERAEFIAEMEALGFFAGRRVRMTNREVTADHISSMLKKHTDRMMTSLWSAYDVRPDEMPEEQQQELLDLIAAAKRLQLELLDAMPPRHDAADSPPAPRAEK
ncbi:MAG: hypothetical protein HY070_07430 [Chloroflexi bacterium]|nr:hypothetical protein [Chloroflexota bacterium]